MENHVTTPISYGKLRSHKEYQLYAIKIEEHLTLHHSTFIILHENEIDRVISVHLVLQYQHIFVRNPRHLPQP